MFIEKWIFMTVTFAMVALLIILWRAGKQIRALRYCFMHFSDAVKREIDENKYLLDQPDAKVIAGVLESFNRTWGQELDWTRGVMARANLSWFSDSDKNYALED